MRETIPTIYDFQHRCGKTEGFKVPEQCLACYMESQAARNKVLEEALRLIAEHSSKTLISAEDDSSYRIGYSQGAHNAFEQMASIADAALREDR